MFDENGKRIRLVNIQKNEQIYPRSPLNDIFSGACKGMCKKYKVRRPLLKSRYSAGQVRCEDCDIFLDGYGQGVIQRGEKLVCKCCNYTVRRKPRDSYHEEKYHDQVTRNVNEPWIDPDSDVTPDDEFKSEKKSTPVYESKSGKSYYELKEFIENEIKPQANYQYVMIKHLLSRVSHKGKITEDLAFYNNKDPSNINEVKKFLYVPVFDVLEKSGFVNKFIDSSIDDIPHAGSRNIIKYELDVFLEEFQLIDLDAKLQKKIDEWNQEHGILTFDRKYEFPDIDWNEHKHLLQEKISTEKEIIENKQSETQILHTVNYWLWSVIKDNWPQIKTENIWGSRVTPEQIQSKVNPGDFIIFYVSGTKLIKGIYEVTSNWEDDSQNLTWSDEKILQSPIYKSKVNLTPIVLGSVPLEDLDNLSIFVGKTINAKNKTLMGTGPGYPANNNKPLPETDFEFIKKQLAKSSAVMELKSEEAKPDTKEILKECPKCNRKIEGPLTEKQLQHKIEDIFGYRQMDPSDPRNRIPQSYCRKCRITQKTIVEENEAKLEHMTVLDSHEDGIDIKHFELQSTEFIKKGQNLTNDELVEKFGVGNMGGIRYSAKNNLIVLCDTESGHYNDEIDKEFQIIYYTGEGQTGDQTLVGGNRRIADSENTSMFYFLEVPQEAGQNKRGALGKIYRFVGKVRYLKHASKTENDINGNPRKVIKFLLEIEK